MKIYGVSANTFFRDLKKEISDDNVSNGAAALAYYLMLSIFPAMLALITLLPYLPIQNLQQTIMDFLNQAMPGDAAKMFSSTINEITSQKKGGLLSFGLLAALWAASNGIYAMMQQLNITYDVKEGRSFFKVRGYALMLTFIFGGLIIGAFGLVIFGDQIQGWMETALGWGTPIRVAFGFLRWGIILGAMTLAYACLYYWGPDVEQEFKFITPGSVGAVLLMVVASLGFSFYVQRFGSYNATYGSLGAVIVMMLWLYITGAVALLGSEINALIEHYSPEGKEKGEKREPRGAAKGDKQGKPLHPGHKYVA
jgi:membrane protein